MAVNLSNWRESPHKIWAITHIDQLIPVQTIARSENPIQLVKSERQSPLEQLKVGSLDLRAFLDHSHTDGFILLHQGKVVYEYYANENNAHSKHLIFSVTKSITSLVAGIVHSQGKLDLDAPVSKYIPEVSKVFENVTVQQCLDMQTGVKYNDNSHEYRAANGWDPLDGSEKAKTLHAFLCQVDAPVDEHKGVYYTSINTDLLGWVIERATGRKFSELIQELLWQPLGAEDDAMITVDAEGSPRAAGGMCATLRDMARVGQLLADGGRDIVPKSWIHETLNGGDVDKFSKSDWIGFFTKGFGKPSYHNCWITDPATNTLVAIGMFGQQLLVDVDKNIVMVKTTSQETAFEPDKHVLGCQLFAEVRNMLASSA